jgi:hypothetical protein
MKPNLIFVALCCVLAGAGTLQAQSAPANSAGANEKQSSIAGEKAATAPVHKRLTIEITGGDKGVAVQDASVYLKYQEERTLRKDKKYALNVKTNHEGIAHVPDVPLGRVLIQVVVDGWKTYGEYYNITDPSATIKIHLDRPPKWY